MLRKWSEFRRRQRENLRASNTPTPPDGEAETEAETHEQLAPDPLRDNLPLEANAPDSGRRRDYGTAGRPLNRQSPFYVGFVGAFGVLVAYGLYKALGQLSQVITLLVVAFFLTLTLNPLVEALSRRGLRRPLCVAVVFIGLNARRMMRPRRFRPLALWIAPAFVLVGVVALMGTRPAPTVAHIVGLTAALAVGGLVGWARGKLVRVDVDPETGMVT